MRVVNRKYHRDYEEIESYEAGIALIGGEVKSAKEGNIKLEDSFVKLIGNEAFLVNAEIQIYKFTRPQGYDPRRTRKLLLHKKELIRLQTKMASGGRLTLAPISCYNKGPLIKVQVALSKGRKDLEKQKLVKERDIALNEKREAKEYMKF
jgi:SsrA-binding protein